MRVLNIMRRAALAARRAWLTFRKHCAEQELEHYTQADAAGPKYTCAMLGHISDLDYEIRRLQGGGAR